VIVKVIEENEELKKELEAVIDLILPFIELELE
jgi:hypothetical protein